MADNSLFLLGPFVQRSVAQGTLLLDAPAAQLRLQAGSGSSWIADVEAALDTQPASLPERLLQMLVEHGLMVRFSARPASIDAFASAFFGVCDGWVGEIFEAPFWSAFHAGVCSEEQVLSFLGQLFHRTAGADVHNRVAVERCSEPGLLPMLERHYREELGHAPILRRGIAACGNAGKEMLRRPPLAATAALVQYMVDTTADSVAYAGCYGIFHAPSTVKTEADLVAQFEHFAELYPFAAPGFEAVCTHSRLDYTLEHQEIALLRWAHIKGELSRDEILRVLVGARGAAAAFGRVFTELHGLGSRREVT